MAYALARELGVVHVDRMLSELTPAAFWEWLVAIKILNDPERDKKNELDALWQLSAVSR